MKHQNSLIESFHEMWDAFPCMVRLINSKHLVIFLLLPGWAHHISKVRRVQISHTQRIDIRVRAFLQHVHHHQQITVIPGSGTGHAGLTDP